MKGFIKDEIPSRWDEIKMTHDELLAKIDDSTDGLKHEHIFPLLIANTKALGAVVQLLQEFNNDWMLNSYQNSYLLIAIKEAPSTCCFTPSGFIILPGSIACVTLVTLIAPSTIRTSTTAAEIVFRSSQTATPRPISSDLGKNQPDFTAKLSSNFFRRVI